MIMIATHIDRFIMIDIWKFILCMTQKKAFMLS